MKNLSFSAVVGTLVLLSGCTYNDIYEPWFDEDKPLYEEDLRPSFMKEDAPTDTLVKDEAVTEPKPTAPVATPSATPVTAIDNDDEPQLELIDTTLSQTKSQGSDTDNMIITREEKYVEIPLMVISESAPSLPLKQPQILSSSVSFMSAHIPYAKGSSKLDARDMANIKETIDICEEYGCILKIIPYASDNNPNPQKLSDKRAQVIKNTLIKSGISDERINIAPMRQTGDYAEIYVEY